MVYEHESSPAPGVHSPNIPIYLQKHLTTSPSHPEDGISVMKSEEVKCEDELSDPSPTTPLTNTSPRQTRQVILSSSILYWEDMPAPERTLLIYSIPTLCKRLVSRLYTAGVVSVDLSPSIDSVLRYRT